VLKEKSLNTKIICCEPDNAPILSSGIPQARNPDGSHSETHPLFRPHLMQGWVPDFIPKLVEEVTDVNNIDEIIPVNGNDAMQLTKDLASKEGIFVGVSAGATLAGALKVAETAPEGSNILCMLPDTGERYLSTPLFADVPVDMSDEEHEISRSTPGYRFDVIEEEIEEAPAPEDMPLDEIAAREIQTIIRDRQNPVVMFGLEWCEFCWSVRKILDRYNINYRSVDLDSAELAENDRGNKLRNVLEKTNDWPTMPQIYIGGEFIGGCTDLFDSCIDKTLQQKLDNYEIPYDKSVDIDPYQLLPNWLHPR
jgi:cysteine synthase A